jgi:hypothetical protein
MPPLRGHDVSALELPLAAISGAPYHALMRFRHALRFALPNLVAILVAAFGYELFEAFVRGDVPEGLTAGAAVVANMPVWALLACIVALVTFLLRLSDIVTRLPGWGFAWLGATWVALACVLVVHAIEEGQVGAGVAIGVAAVVIWLAIHRRIPGWPGAQAEQRGPESGSSASRSSGRDLP